VANTTVNTPSSDFLETLFHKLFGPRNSLWIIAWVRRASHSKSNRPVLPTSKRNRRDQSRPPPGTTC